MVGRGKGRQVTGWASDPLLLGGCVGLGWGCVGGWRGSCPPSVTYTLSSLVCGLCSLVFMSSQGHAPTRNQCLGAVGGMGCTFRNQECFQSLSNSTSAKSWASPSPTFPPLYHGARPRDSLRGWYFRRLPVGQAPEQMRMKGASWEHLLRDLEFLPYHWNWTSAAVGGI